MRVARGRLPLGMVGLVLVLVLAATGVIYGNWSQSLSINGNVRTAKMEAKWVLGNPDCYDDDKDSKGEARTTISLAGDKLTVVVDNAYPFYGARCYFDLRNNGKLPLEIGGLGLKPGTGLTCDPVVVKPSSVKATCDELTVDLQDGGEQINEGQSNTLSIRIDVSKNARPDDKYSFSAWACVEPFGTDQCASKANGEP